VIEQPPIKLTGASKSEKEGSSHALSFPATPLCGGGSVVYFGAKNRQKVTQFSEMGIFCGKYPFLKSKLRKILTENWGVIKFMPPD
jgi:hypothetical protein